MGNPKGSKVLYRTFFFFNKSAGTVRWHSFVLLKNGWVV